MVISWFHRKPSLSSWLQIRRAASFSARFLDSSSPSMIGLKPRTITGTIFPKYRFGFFSRPCWMNCETRMVALSWISTLRDCSRHSWRTLMSRGRDSRASALISSLSRI